MREISLGANLPPKYIISIMNIHAIELLVNWVLKTTFKDLLNKNDIPVSVLHFAYNWIFPLMFYCVGLSPSKHEHTQWNVSIF